MSVFLYKRFRKVVVFIIYEVYLLFIAVQAYGPTQFEVSKECRGLSGTHIPRIPYIRSTPRQVTRHPPDGMHPENPGKCGRCRVFVAWSRGMRGQPTNQPTRPDPSQLPHHLASHAKPCASGKQFKFELLAVQLEVAYETTNLARTWHRIWPACADPNWKFKFEWFAFEGDFDSSS